MGFLFNEHRLIVFRLNGYLCSVIALFFIGFSQEASAGVCLPPFDTFIGDEICSDNDVKENITDIDEKCGVGLALYKCLEGKPNCQKERYAQYVRTFTDNSDVATKNTAIANINTQLDSCSRDFSNTSPVAPDEPKGMPLTASATVDYSAKLAICKTANSKAEECCESPLSCAFNIDLLENTSPMLVDQLLQTAGYAATAGDLKKTCQTSKNLNVVMGVMNTYIYGKCMSRVNECREVCDQGYDKAETYLTNNSCTSILSKKINEDTQAYADCQAAKTYKEDFAKARGECRDQFKEEAGKYVMQAVLNLKNYLEAQSCEKQIDAFELPQVAAGPDCTDPANASNPVCTPDCSAPGAAQNNILCRGFSSVGSGSMTSLSSSPRTDGGGNSRANLGLTGEGGQETPFAFTDPNDNKAKSKGIGPGGGGGLPGASGGGGGDSPFAASSAGSGAGGYNTNIANPTSRAGYRAVSAGAPSSEGGYSSPTGRVAGQGDGGPINLRSLQNKNRSIAGLGSPRAIKDISKAHEDIFNKITNAMFRQCETNTYEDCTNNVRVNTKPGG